MEAEKMPLNPTDFDVTIMIVKLCKYCIFSHGPTVLGAFCFLRLAQKYLMQIQHFFAWPKANLCESISVPPVSARIQPKSSPNRPEFGLNCFPPQGLLRRKIIKAEFGPISPKILPKSAPKFDRNLTEIHPPFLLNFC